MGQRKDVSGGAPAPGPADALPQGPADGPPAEPVDLPGPDWGWRLRLRAWREGIRANPATRHAYRWSVALIGLVVVVAGAIMIPFPGPGWLVVFLGVGIWASEFGWAQRLLGFGRRHLDRWVAWLAQQGWTVRGLVAFGCWLIVMAMFWILFRLTGLPTWLPDMAEEALRRYAAL